MQWVAVQAWVKMRSSLFIHSFIACLLHARPYTDMGTMRTNSFLPSKGVEMRLGPTSGKPPQYLMISPGQPLRKCLGKRKRRWSSRDREVGQGNSEVPSDEIGGIELADWNLPFDNKVRSARILEILWRTLAVCSCVAGHIARCCIHWPPVGHTMETLVTFGERALCCCHTWRANRSSPLIPPHVTLLVLGSSNHVASSLLFRCYKYTPTSGPLNLPLPLITCPAGAVGSSLYSSLCSNVLLLGRALLAISRETATAMCLVSNAGSPKRYTHKGISRTWEVTLVTKGSLQI